MKYIFSILAICFTLVSFGQKKTLVASASMFADMAENIAGNLVDVKYIVPRGQDPHLYKPTPSDVIMVEKADVIIINGLTFEGWVAKLIENSGTKAETFVITEGLSPIQSSKYDNSYDPHAWMDAQMAQTYIANIRDALISIAPEHKVTFEANYQAYSKELIELDQFIQEEIKKIPEAQRILITSHDAFAYFGKRYGLRLEAIVGISTEAEVQSSDIIRVHKVIMDSKVPAIFMESTIDPKILKQIAKDNKIIIGGELFADSLGDKDSPAYTYIDMLRNNTITIVKALTNKAEEVQDERLSDSSGNSLYIYLGLFLVLALIIIFLVRRLNQ